MSTARSTAAASALLYHRPAHDGDTPVLDANLSGFNAPQLALNATARPQKTDPRQAKNSNPYISIADSEPLKPNTHHSNPHSHSQRRGPQG
jgi:hypothetical protein